MNKLAFIIPYFGKFNNYFNLFLKSCETNKNFCDWIIFTDDKREFIYPSNVYVNYMSWSCIQSYFQSKFEFKLSLNYPYKLCDFKPSYGYVFSEYLKEYDYWGYCDTDVIFGDLQFFVSPLFNNNYDKIFNLGHCTIFRNIEDISKLFMKPYCGELRYQKVFTVPYNLSFDEEYNESVNNIFEEYKKNTFTDSYAANLYTKSSNFLLTKLDIKTKKYKTEKISKNFFLWRNGKLFRFVKRNGKIEKEEYLYLHMQARPMKVNISNAVDTFKIIPNSFDSLETEYDTIWTDFSKINLKHFNLHCGIINIRVFWTDVY